MNTAELKAAVAEAERFIKAAKIALDRETPWGGKYNAAAKRASLDLTRALADYRQGKR